jgi:hypothetical protein
MLSGYRAAPPALRMLWMLLLARCLCDRGLMCLEPLALDNSDGLQLFLLGHEHGLHQSVQRHRKAR